MPSKEIRFFHLALPEVPIFAMVVFLCCRYGSFLCAKYYTFAVKRSWYLLAASVGIFVFTHKKAKEILLPSNAEQNSSQKNLFKWPQYKLLRLSVKISYIWLLCWILANLLICIFNIPYSVIWASIVLGFAVTACTSCLNIVFNSTLSQSILGGEN